MNLFGPNQAMQTTIDLRTEASRCNHRIRLHMAYCGPRPAGGDAGGPQSHHVMILPVTRKPVDAAVIDI